MSSAATDKAWETLGRVDPYWAVISNDAYRGRRLTDQQLAAFLKSGADHVDDFWRTCRRLFGDDFAPRRVLDFGCGVGRVTLPLCPPRRRVVGIDIADSMLSVARELLERNAVQRAARERRCHAVSDTRPVRPRAFRHRAAAHSAGPWTDAGQASRQLAGDTGVVAPRAHYNRSRGRRWRASRTGWSLLPRSIPARAEIQIDAYPLNTLFKLIQDAGVGHVHAELTNHAGHLGALLFFRKG
jgi:hypothetical protein